MAPSPQKLMQQRLAFDAFIKLYPFTIDDLDGEEWRPIEGYEGIYEVSNHGRVKSFQRNNVYILRPTLYRGYLAVVLHKYKKVLLAHVHRLVAKAFIPNPDNKPQVNHCDGCKLNSFVGNLEWATYSENIRHAYRTGLRPAGENNSMALLTAEQVTWCRENYKPRDKEFGIRALAKKLGVSNYVINSLLHGRTYKQEGGTIHTRAWVPDDVRKQIRSEYKAGVRGAGYASLAKKYGVDPKTIWNIVNEK